MQKIGKILVAAAPGLVDNADLRKKCDLQPQQPDPGAQVNVFIVKKELLVEAACLQVYLPAKQHEHAAYPIRENTAIPDDIITPLAAARCLADDLERSRKETRAVFNLSRAIEHQRRNHADPNVFYSIQQGRKNVRNDTDIGVDDAKKITLGQAKRSIVIFTKPQWNRITNSFYRER